MDFQKFEEELQWHIPGHCEAGVREYILRGCPTGGFLEAIISGQLFQAYTRADEININSIYSYVKFFVNNAPSECYGDSDAYKKWVDGGGLFGLYPDLASSWVGDMKALELKNA